MGDVFAITSLLICFISRNKLIVVVIFAHHHHRNVLLTRVVFCLPPSTHHVSLSPIASQTTLITPRRRSRPKWPGVSIIFCSVAAGQNTPRFLFLRASCVFRSLRRIYTMFPHVAPPPPPVPVPAIVHCTLKWYIMNDNNIPYPHQLKRTRPRIITLVLSRPNSRN